ncbi:MAG: hypothetical protein HQ564_09635 [Candidatus Saganbacteria bacterium]|nr:hypothetical protein [Candidatus Saganbacteria bacterium]
MPPKVTLSQPGPVRSNNGVAAKNSANKNDAGSAPVTAPPSTIRDIRFISPDQRGGIEAHATIADLDSHQKITKITGQNDNVFLVYQIKNLVMNLAQRDQITFNEAFDKPPIQNMLYGIAETRIKKVPVKKDDLNRIIEIGRLVRLEKKLKGSPIPALFRNILISHIQNTPLFELLSSEIKTAKEMRNFAAGLLVYDKLWIREYKNVKQAGISVFKILYGILDSKPSQIVDYYQEAKNNGSKLRLLSAILMRLDPTDYEPSPIFNTKKAVAIAKAADTLYDQGFRAGTPCKQCDADKEKYFNFAQPILKETIESATDQEKVSIITGLIIAISEKNWDPSNPSVALATAAIEDSPLALEPILFEFLQNHSSILSRLRYRLPVGGKLSRIFSVLESVLENLSPLEIIKFLNTIHDNALGTSRTKKAVNRVIALAVKISGIPAFLVGFAPQHEKNTSRELERVLSEPEGSKNLATALSMIKNILQSQTNNRSEKGNNQFDEEETIALFKELKINQVIGQKSYRTPLYQSLKPLLIEIRKALDEKRFSQLGLALQEVKDYLDRESIASPYDEDEILKALLVKSLKILTILTSP